ncbi:hypothetical protein C8F01DRAFT_1086036 [Mycena amicta]|nr:hypothetical protein C8F01DRAFT_1086036 [Mycena amicta]
MSLRRRMDMVLMIPPASYGQAYTARIFTLTTAGGRHWQRAGGGAESLGREVHVRRPRLSLCIEMGCLASARGCEQHLRINLSAMRTALSHRTACVGSARGILEVAAGSSGGLPSPSWSGLPRGLEQSTHPSDHTVSGPAQTRNWRWGKEEDDGQALSKHAIVSINSSRLRALDDTVGGGGEFAGFPSTSSVEQLRGPSARILEGKQRSSWTASTSCMSRKPSDRLQPPLCAKGTPLYPSCRQACSSEITTDDPFAASAPLHTSSERRISLSGVYLQNWLAISQQEYTRYKSYSLLQPHFRIPCASDHPGHSHNNEIVHRESSAMSHPAHKTTHLVQNHVASDSHLPETTPNGAGRHASDANSTIPFADSLAKPTQRPRPVHEQQQDRVRASKHNCARSTNVVLLLCHGCRGCLWPSFAYPVIFGLLFDSESSVTTTLERVYEKPNLPFNAASSRWPGTIANVHQYVPRFHKLPSQRLWGSLVCAQAAEPRATKVWSLGLVVQLEQGVGLNNAKALPSSQRINEGTELWSSF